MVVVFLLPTAFLLPQYSWLNGDRCKPAAGKCHALPFDENFAPKPAVAAMLQVLQNATDDAMELEW